MTTKTRNANVQVEEANVNANVAEEITNQFVEEAAREVDEDENSADDLFASFFEEDDDNPSSDKTTEDIIKELLASGTCKRLNNLTVKNVVAKPYDNHTLLTFVVKEFVVGSIASGENDAFGEPIMKLGKSHNVQSSSYAVAAVMKENPRTAVFAADMIEKPKLANILFAGGHIDVILQYVPAREEYINPFARNAKPETWERDMMIHHIIKLEMGEVGLDKYHAMINQ